VLPDAASGQGPGTLARKLSRCKEGEPAPQERSACGGALFAVRVQSLLSITRVAPAPLLQNKSGGTSLIGAGKLSRYRIFVGGTSAVSRYKLSRSQKSVSMQDFNCGQVRVSGCKNHYQSVLGAGARAKSVTSNLPILSVLGVRNFYFYITFIITLPVECP
jgi:hypothetical protein